MSLVEVSVIVPVYNVEKYIAACIQSLLLQTFQNFEILVVNDGSSDRSIDIVKTFADERILIFEKENGGLSDARNYGLERAKGKFIYFVDPDDWIEPSLLKDNIEIINQHNLDFVVFGFQKDYYGQNGKLVKSEKVLPRVEAICKGVNVHKIDDYHLSILGYAWNKIYRKSFLDKHHFVFPKGISLVEDIIFNAAVYEVSDKILFNRNCYYHYMIRPVLTLTGMYHEKAFEWLLLKIDAVRDFLTAWDLPENRVNQLISSVYVQGLRFTIHRFFYFNSKDPALMIHILKHNQTVKLIDLYRPDNLKDFAYKLLIKYKFVSLIKILKKKSSLNS